MYFDESGGTLCLCRSALVAQRIEQLPSKQWVVGSIPARGTILQPQKAFQFRFRSRSFSEIFSVRLFNYLEKRIPRTASRQRSHSSPAISSASLTSKQEESDSMISPLIREYLSVFKDVITNADFWIREQENKFLFGKNTQTSVRLTGYPLKIEKAENSNESVFMQEDFPMDLFKGKKCIGTSQIPLTMRRRPEM